MKEPACMKNTMKLKRRKKKQEIARDEDSFFLFQMKNMKERRKYIQ